MNTRGWQTSQAWKINEPLVESVSYGKVAYSVEIGNRKRHHLLISGSEDTGLQASNEAGIFANWLYTLDTNSWQNVDNGDFPPIESHPLLIQFCSKIVAFQFDYTFDNFSIPSKAWVFDTVSLNWQETQVHGYSRFYINFDDNEVAAVLAFQSQTNCLCNQSAFVLLHSSDFRSSMHAVRCVNQEGTESYEWTHIKSNNKETSHSAGNFIASAYSGKIVLYNPVKQTLWTFENEAWKSITAVRYPLTLIEDESLSQTFNGAVATEHSNFIVFSILSKKVLNFNLKSNEYIIEDVVGNIPGKRYNGHTSLVEDQKTIVVFTYDVISGIPQVWKFIYEHKVWIWQRLARPDNYPAPTELSTYTLKKNSFTLAQPFTDELEQDSSSSFIWNLDLRSMQWSKKPVFSSISDVANAGYEASCWIDGCCFVALRNQNDKKFIQAWIYNDTDNEIKLLELASIIPRSLMSFVSVNKTSAILFGGRNSNSSLIATFDETWIIHLQPMFKRRQADGEITHSVRPSARFNHAATIMQSKMYVFGGMNASEECLDDVWVFDVNTERWSELIADNRGPNLSNSSECDCSAASTPGQLLITIKSIDLDTSSGFAYRSCIMRVQTWLFIVQAKTWHLIAEFKYAGSSIWETSLPKSFFWRGFLLMLDTLKSRIYYLTVRCPPGFTSSNISEKSCHFCKKGYYRETIASDPDCVQCPNGLTTISTGARNIEECSMCSVDHCKYGKCVPDFNEGSLRPACQCFGGFTGSTCQYPTYWLIGAGIILVVALVSSGGTAYLLLLNRKRKSERSLRNEVTVLTNVWEIDEDEVMPGELIGSGASGSVYKAFYRNITVAVKKMVAVGFSKSIEDFETEIMFMRTVRHKNIVLFIGAGKSQPGDVPFLVMEYMERGSLRNVLYDLSIDINYQRKIKFAMDSARGMHFLHTLEPPRIHRDLKSDNLLVSKDWIVKVADFGLGRTVNGNVKQNDKQQIRRQNGSHPQHISLLPEREGLSFAGVGTARWRAPEFTLREPYGTAVDVYRLLVLQFNLNNISILIIISAFVFAVLELCCGKFGQDSFHSINTVSIMK